MAVKSASCHGRSPVKVPVQPPSIRFPEASSAASSSLAAFIESVPAGTVVELAPGRYRGPIRIDRPLTLKGAGDLTRIEGDGDTSAVQVAVDEPGLVYFESLTIADGGGANGGGLAIHSGRVRLFNLRVHGCSATESGGGLFVEDAEVEARLLRMSELSAARGGAVAVRGDARFSIFDGEIRDASADVGGAIHVSEAAHVRLSGLTLGRTRARAAAGGQAVWVGGARAGELLVELDRVRFEDAPLGRPLVVDDDRPGRVTMFECDASRDVLDNLGIVDGGTNHWR